MANGLTRRCKGQTCDAEIVWVTVERGVGPGRTTRKMPLDCEPADVAPPLHGAELRGMFVFIEDTVVRQATPTDKGPFFRSHFATCPDADDFR